MATRVPLFVRITLALAGVVGLATLVAMGLTDWSLRGDLERAARGRLHGAARAAAQLVDLHLSASWQRYKAISGTPQFRANLEVNDPPTLAHYAAELARNQGAARVLFLNVHGNVVASAGGEPFDATAAPAAGAALVTRHGQPYVVVGLPLETAGQPVGRLVVVESLGDATVRQWSRLCGARVRFDSDRAASRTLVAPVTQKLAPGMTVAISVAAERQALANARRQLLLAGATAFVLALVVSLALSRPLVRTIQTIKEAAERIGGGDFAVHIGSTRRDEIGDVARAVDHMAVELSVARERLRAEEEQFRLLSACSPVGILQMDPAGHCIYSNARWQEISGLSAEESLADGWTAAVLLEDRDRWVTTWRTAMRERRAMQSGLQIRSPRGRTRWVQAHATVMLSGEDGLLRGYIVTVEDITPLKEAEAELAAARDQALEVMQLKSEFLANVSHELRTPMTGILGMAEILLDSPLSSQQQGYADTLLRSGKDLLRIIDDVLDFSSLETERPAPETKPLRPREALAEIRERVTPRASRKHLALRTDLHPEVPETLLGDLEGWRRVLVTLIDNAIKFTHRGEVRVQIGVDSASEDQIVLHCAVADTGIGIPEEKQPTIFDAFVQADGSMSRRYGGTGLGLAISAHLVRAMGGRIWVESQVGRGSTFHFTAPFATPRHAAAEPPVPPAVRAFAGALDSAGHRSPPEPEKSAGDPREHLDRVRALQEETRSLVEELRSGLRCRDPQAVERAASRLRNVLDAPATRAARNKALRLEALGCAGNLEPAAHALAALERELARLGNDS
jgi:PAS domain S-box-containing protein